jgi:hypothetical protein
LSYPLQYTAVLHLLLLNLDGCNQVSNKDKKIWMESSIVQRTSDIFGDGFVVRTIALLCFKKGK